MKAGATKAKPKGNPLGRRVFSDSELTGNPDAYMVLEVPVDLEKRKTETKAAYTEAFDTGKKAATLAFRAGAKLHSLKELFGLVKAQWRDLSDEEKKAAIKPQGWVEWQTAEGLNNKTVARYINVYLACDKDEANLKDRTIEEILKGDQAEKFADYLATDMAEPLIPGDWVVLRNSSSLEEHETLRPIIFASGTWFEVMGVSLDSHYKTPCILLKSGGSNLGALINLHERSLMEFRLPVANETMPTPSPKPATKPEEDGKGKPDGKGKGKGKAGGKGKGDGTLPMPKADKFSPIVKQVRITSSFASKCVTDFLNHSKRRLTQDEITMIDDAMNSFVESFNKAKPQTQATNLPHPTKQRTA